MRTVNLFFRSEKLHEFKGLFGQLHADYSRRRKAKKMIIHVCVEVPKIVATGLDSSHRRAVEDRAT
jgi:hypothetical protein